jgi:hypothetical protein
MSDFDTMPLNVKKLSIACFFRNVGAHQIRTLSADEVAALAASAGLSLAEFTESVKWLWAFQKNANVSIDGLTRNRDP